MTKLTIRERTRRLASPPEGMRQHWVEWQVVHGRKVVKRCDSEAEAKQFKAKLEALGTAIS